MILEELESAALELDPKQRALLAEKPLVSLGNPAEQKIERLWVAETQRRDDELNADDSREVFADIVLDKARARLK